MAFFQFNKQTNAPAKGGARSNVKFSEKGIAEIADGQIVVFIPREKIQRIELKFGSHAERPMIQLVLGICLLTVGLGGGYLEVNGGVRGMYWGLGLLAFGVIGIYCLYEALRRGHYVSVVCGRDKRRLRLAGAISNEQLSRLTQQAAEFGYDLRDCPAQEKPALTVAS